VPAILGEVALRRWLRAVGAAECDRYVDGGNACGEETGRLYTAACGAFLASQEAAFVDGLNG
jgi:hypothetical protein